MVFVSIMILSSDLNSGIKHTAKAASLLMNLEYGDSEWQSLSSEGPGPGSMRCYASSESNTASS